MITEENLLKTDDNTKYYEHYFHEQQTLYIFYSYFNGEIIKHSS